jgi:hypothetical protein
LISKGIDEPWRRPALCELFRLKHLTTLIAILPFNPHRETFSNYQKLLLKSCFIASIKELETTTQRLSTVALERRNLPEGSVAKALRTHGNLAKHKRFAKPVLSCWNQTWHNIITGRKNARQNKPRKRRASQKLDERKMA